MKKGKTDLAWKRSPNIVWRRNAKGDITVISLQELDYFYTIDALAADTWELLDGKKNSEAIVAKLCTGKKFDKKLVGRELQKFLRKLEKADLIKTAKDSKKK